jgi:hypothetical protein
MLMVSALWLWSRLGLALALMTRAITVRLDEADHAALTRQADQLRVRPGTLARMLVHAGLRADKPDRGGSDARAALERLVQRSQQRPPGDAVTLVDEARVALGADQRASSSTPVWSSSWWWPMSVNTRPRLTTDVDFGWGSGP